MKKGKLNLKELSVESFDLTVPLPTEPSDAPAFDPEPAPTEGSSCVSRCTRWDLVCC